MADADLAPSPKTVFDHLIDGRMPASFVHRDDRCVAFLDLRPITRGHLLVVPRQSVATLDALDADTRAHLWEIALKVAAAARTALGARAQHFLVNDGRAASQSVPHVHIHVVPRYRGDRWVVLARMTAHVAMIAWRPLREDAAQRARLDADAAAIAAALTAG